MKIFYILGWEYTRGILNFLIEYRYGNMYILICTYMFVTS